MLLLQFDTLSAATTARNKLIRHSQPSGSGSKKHLLNQQNLSMPVAAHTMSSSRASVS